MKKIPAILLISISAAFAACILGLIWFVCRIPASPLDEISITASDGKRIARGEYLARLGDCGACHSIGGNQPFSGGLKMATPLGAIYSTNITPDPQLGIGMYRLGDFDRAVRAGIGHDGHRLYPAMPYPSYAKLSDDDIKALYAFFRDSIKPAHVANRKNDIPFLLNIRWPLAFWNLLFVPHHPYIPNSTKDAQWNRGAYLVEGVGHCGACHTPRNPLTMSEKSLDNRHKSFLSGAEIDHWYAPSLRNSVNTGLGRWSEEDIYHFLKDGRNSHGVVFGSMAEVYNNSTQFMSDDDIYAMAHYLKSLPGGKKSERKKWEYKETDSSSTMSEGANLYRSKCGTCHGIDGKGQTPWIPPLAGSASSLIRQTGSSVNITLNGSPRVIANAVPDAYRMPSFREQLSDQQIAEILSYIRSSWGNNGKNVAPADVRKLRQKTTSASPNITVLQLK